MDLEPVDFVRDGDKCRGRLVTAAVLILVMFCSYVTEKHADWFGWLVFFELKSHACLQFLDARNPRVERVSIIEIDDETHYKYLHPENVTNRAFLGDLISILVDAHVAVIAMDVQLTKQPADQENKDRRDDNQYLLAAITSAADSRVPVVLTCGLREEQPSRGFWRTASHYAMFWREDDPHSKEFANIYDSNELPSSVRVGYDNGPLDFSQIPLMKDVPEPVCSSQSRLNSFAIEIVNAYEDALHIDEKTLNSNRIKKAIAKNEFVYGKFLTPDKFPAVSALKVIRRDRETLEHLNHRIAIIGGHYHEQYNAGDWVDTYDSPIGPMQGLHFHANYVESLLANDVKIPVATWFAVLFDGVLGLLMIWAVHRRRDHFFATLAVFLIPIAVAYLSFVNANYNMNFILPLGLLVIHLFLEHYFDLRKLARVGRSVRHGS